LDEEIKDILLKLVKGQTILDVKINRIETEVIKLFTEKDQILHYDALTELFNRKKMRMDVDILLDYKDKKFAFLFIDLDKFKSVNDNYGHLAGDNILKTVAMRLKDIISSRDTIYRIGGDEFIIILRDLKVTSTAEKFAVTALKTLSTAFSYKENQLFIGASIGISIFPEHGIDEDTLSKEADLAMYKVKRNGGNGYKIYSSNMKEEDHLVDKQAIKNAIVFE